MSNLPSNPNPPKRPWWLRLGRNLAVLIAIWYSTDFGYSCFVAWRHQVWEQSKLRDADGVLDGCAEFSVGAGQDAILLIHGINGSPYNWRKMAPALADGGYHVRAMRLPGFAEPLRQYGKYSTADWLNAVDAEIGDLKAQYRHVYIIAQSLGGAVAIRYVLDQPHVADGLVLLSPAVEVSNNRSPLLSTRFWHTFCKGLVFTNVVTSNFNNDAHDPAELDASHESAFTPRRVIDQTFELIDMNRGQAGHIRLPLAMFLTHHDNVIDWRAAEMFFHAAGSQKKVLTFHDEAGHPLSFDYGWEGVAQEIIRFLGQEKSSGGTSGP